MFSWYQKRECTFIIIAIIAVTGEIERSAAAWSQTSIDTPEEPHSAACDSLVGQEKGSGPQVLGIKFI